LGTSIGANNLSGYGFDNLAPWAIKNLNPASTPAVLAMHNGFDAVTGDSIAAAFQDPNSAIQYSQAQTLLSCPADVSLVCASEVPTGATDLAGFVAQGGYFSANAATVSFSDTPHPAGSGTITRTYTVTDVCGASATGFQIIVVNDTIPPVVTSSAFIIQKVDTGRSYATVTIPQATATDNCTMASLVGVRSDNRPLGDTYPEGDTIITWTATDTSGNTGTAQQTVRVIGLPVITGQPQSRTNGVGSTATFTVAAASPARLRYQWKKGDTAINGATNATLVLANLSLADSGTYRVEISNLAGSITSSDATLLVVVRPVLTLLSHSHDDTTLSLTGGTGLSYAIQGTTNLVDWVNLHTNQAPYTFVDTNAAALDHRFYRAFFVQ
jgi:hypothetical protein